VSTQYAGGYGFAPPAWSPDGSALAFPALAAPLDKRDSQSYRESGAYRAVSIHLLDLASGQERPLLSGAVAGALSPSWSPDGQSLAFTSTRSGSPEIWRVGRNGADLRQVTSDGQWHSGPVWRAERKP
jgi:TolB protein